jgi:hypothetical protein
MTLIMIIRLMLSHYLVSLLTRLFRELILFLRAKVFLLAVFGLLGLAGRLIVLFMGRRSICIPLSASNHHLFYYQAYYHMYKSEYSKFLHH